MVTKKLESVSEFSRRALLGGGDEAYGFPMIAIRGFRARVANSHAAPKKKYFRLNCLPAMRIRLGLKEGVNVFGSVGTTKLKKGSYIDLHCQTTNLTHPNTLATCSRVPSVKSGHSEINFSI